MGNNQKKSAKLNALRLAIALVPAPLFFMATAHAAKQVPTIRIELPKKSTPNNSPDPNLGTDELTPKIPLGENDRPFEAGDEEPNVLDEVSPDTEPVTEEDLDAETPDENERQADEPSDTPERGTTETLREPAKVFYDTTNLPEAVKKTRDRLLKAAKSGNVEALRMIFKDFSEQPIVSFDEQEDPVDHIIANSGDGKGLETLAILLEVLESGYVHRDEGADGEVYIWPYFVDIPPEDLKSEQLIELFQIITAGDYEDMVSYGTYIFYRAGIAPNGDLKFFVAGD